ncbi:hypothetical protein SCHPADRAFT_908469 [Schizopora paradoxa]|uniref:RING-type E3 ubiquitin transferase n=1 Tax=Schizopora paradoxa TaxID=27342 RepID=A0A0H2RGJ7_9AGAM|nr:hypothetical protein SCHPADRAFT_908469 [Schizopora paradoxa]
MAEERTNTPLDDAERIRLRRLAKLGASSPSPSPQRSSTPPAPTPPVQTPKSTVLKRKPATTATLPSTSKPPPPVKAPAGPVKLDLVQWENYTVGDVLRVTLDRSYAEKHHWEHVWLKHLAAELEAEDPQALKPLKLSCEISDRLLISRLDVNPEAMSDDLDYLPVLASLPQSQTVFEYLVGCWKRQNNVRLSLGKKNYAPQDLQHIISVLDKLRDLTISYAGLVLQEPDMFTQPEGKVVGPEELVSSLLSLSSLTGPLSSNSSASFLGASEVPQFLSDIVQRFEPDDELDGVLGPVVRLLVWNKSLARQDGIAGADAGWRSVVSGLEALVNNKAIAAMIPRLPEWNPEIATPATFEFISLMGPLMRLGVYERDWPYIAKTFFLETEAERKSAANIESSYASLRGTMKSLQSALFRIFDRILRASPQSREFVLQYFSRVISLNIRRAGMQVDFNTVASDSFMTNVLAVLLRFAEPFMDATYSKLDRVDPLYLAKSSRVEVKDETRIKADGEEVSTWMKEVQAAGGPSPTFISDIFYLTSAVNHYGLNRTLQTYEELHKHLDDLKRHLEFMTESLNSLTPTNSLYARTQHAIKQTNDEIAKIHSEQFAFQTQLLDPEFIFRQIGFTNFVEAWLLRMVDPSKRHPSPAVEVPLPRDVPIAFRMLPEYFIEDIVDFLLFLMRTSPMSFDLTGKTELITWALTFLRSSWYIKNPFLKAKINETIFYGCLQYGPERIGVLGQVLNSHPFALKHLMPALMSFYIEVEQTGASSQFYDKFNARRNIAWILKVIWDNPTHRQALKDEAKNSDKFVRFVNLMINDVTYLMDESLSELTQISHIQHEMDTPAWNTQTLQHRREREGTLRSLERHASGFTTLGRSTVELLKIFTKETKAPFMTPEIVDRLAAMLDYNLDALVGPKCTDLIVKDKEKFKFDPRALLSDILQVYLNLSDQGEFVRGVANDGRSYKKELFEKAAGIARRTGMKTEDEIEQLRLFVVKVEETRATMEAEEDLGEVPDEFLDPLMYTLMRDPVTLPSSKVVIDRSTIKAHLLSDTKDPFNRSPMSIEDVVPNPELKARIDEFLAGRRNKATALDIPESEVVKMDTDEN